MTVMSGQHYISRAWCSVQRENASCLQFVSLRPFDCQVTFLFSIYDMDGDGCLNLSEIVIAVQL